MLKNHDEEGGQMEALTELCEVLSMGQEEILIGFSVDSFLPILVEILNMEHRPEMMLLSCRATAAAASDEGTCRGGGRFAFQSLRARNSFSETYPRDPDALKAG